MNILLTGCAGFIGSHLAESLCLQGWKVYGIDNLSNGLVENMRGLPADRFTFIEADLRKQITAKLPPIDCIMHLAAAGSVPRSMKDPEFFMQNNVVGFHNVLEYARKNHIQLVYYASSSSVYGNAQKYYRYETDPTEPCSPYAASKSINEVMAQTYERAFWITCHGLRFFNVFGPRQRFDSAYAAAIPRFIKGILDDGRIQIYGDGEQIRTFTPVGFVVEAVTSMIANPGHLKNAVYNITSPDYAASVNDTAKLVGSVLKMPYEVDYEPERAGDVKSSIGSGRDLSDAVGLLSQDHSVVDWVEATCEWAKERLQTKLN